MSFCDSSAIVPLLVVEERSNQVRELWRDDSQPFVWWGTPVECRSALARRSREGHRLANCSVLRRDFADSRRSGGKFPPSETVRQTAISLFLRYAMRAADALQLAAAIAVVSQPGVNHAFVSFDERLRNGARSESFIVLP